MTWQTLTRDMLPRFSPAQRAVATQVKPVLPLDLLDGPKEPARPLPSIRRTAGRGAR
jgi:hypothetical protein